MSDVAMEDPQEHETFEFPTANQEIETTLKNIPIWVLCAI